MENMLGLAIAIAADAFKHKKDKQGKPYILHCLTVMNGVEDEHDKICAVLHDYPEDIFDNPDVAFKLLRGYGFDEDDIRVLDLLTHRKGDDYLTVYIKKIATCPRATRIKLKDLEHNSNISRLKDFSKKSFDNLEKYHIAFQYLSKLK